LACWRFLLTLYDSLPRITKYFDLSFISNKLIKITRSCLAVHQRGGKLFPYVIAVDWECDYTAAGQPILLSTQYIGHHKEVNKWIKTLNDICQLEPNQCPSQLVKLDNTLKKFHFPKVEYIIDKITSLFYEDLYLGIYRARTTTIAARVGTITATAQVNNEEYARMDYDSNYPPSYIPKEHTPTTTTTTQPLQPLQPPARKRLLIDDSSSIAPKKIKRNTTPTPTPPLAIIRPSSPIPSTSTSTMPEHEHQQQGPILSLKGKKRLTMKQYREKQMRKFETTNFPNDNFDLSAVPSRVPIPRIYSRTSPPPQPPSLPAPSQPPPPPLAAASTQALKEEYRPFSARSSSPPPPTDRPQTKQEVNFAIRRKELMDILHKPEITSFEWSRVMAQLRILLMFNHFDFSDFDEW
jgi:hypothetical protein